MKTPLYNFLAIVLFLVLISAHDNPDEDAPSLPLRLEQHTSCSEISSSIITVTLGATVTSCSSANRSTIRSAAIFTPCETSASQSFTSPLTSTPCSTLLITSPMYTNSSSSLTIVTTPCNTTTPPTHTTTYATTLPTLCSTGWTSSIYTIAETCTDPTPSWPSNSSGYLPPGFTTTTGVCEKCVGGPVTAVVTVPCETTAVGGGKGERVGRFSSTRTSEVAETLPTGDAFRNCTASVSLAAGGRKRGGWIGVFMGVVLGSLWL